jgi:DNA-binding MarR family transcriptional regulator
MNNRSHFLTEVDRLVHEPSRSIILAILTATQSADFLYLQRETGLTKGNLTIHLSKLEKAGYIRIEKTYRQKIPMTLCSITNKGREIFENYRNQLKQFLEDTNQILHPLDPEE